MDIVHIPSAGYEMTADWYQGRTTDKIILFLYGYSSRRTDHHEFMLDITEKSGASALVFDYAGHGDSPFLLGDTKPAQELLEVTYAFDWLRKHHPSAEITVMGTSFGGFLAAHLSHYRTLDQLILSAPAIYKPSDLYAPWQYIDRDWTRDVFRKDVAALQAHPLFSNILTTQRTLVITHELDDTIPTETTDAFARAFRAENVLVNGLHHSLMDPKNPTESIDAYRSKVVGWILD